jgi:hypothetical protein
MPSQLQELKALGVTARVPAGTALPGDSLSFVAFDVDEDHPNWSKLRLLLARWKVSDFVSTEFTKNEIEAATWVDLVPDWHHGYPQPDEPKFGYLRATYDLSEWCDTCGIGMKQKAPFQMKGEPKWGRRAILQLNWVFDEYFVTPEIWSSVFKPRGIACRPVTNTKGAELKTVVQLVVEEEVGIVTEGLTPERCATCGRVKYLPVTRGFFPALTTKPTGAIVKTREYFGSGAAAHKRVLVSQELARALVAAKVRGASFWPVQSTNGAS